jgi:hypothetical protein
MNSHQEQGKAYMSQSNEPPLPSDRPVCANCGWTMWIARIEQLDASKDQHVYKCERCEHEQTFIAKL